MLIATLSACTLYPDVTSKDITRRVDSFIQDRRKHPTYLKIDIVEYLLAISSRFDLILRLEKYSTHVFMRWTLICSWILVDRMFKCHRRIFLYGQYFFIEFNIIFYFFNKRCGRPCKFKW